MPVHAARLYGAAVARDLMRRLLDGLFLGAGYLAAFFLVVMFVIMLVMSVGRLSWLNINIKAGDDFAAWAMAAMSFLGLAHTFKKGEMIRVGLLLEHLKGRTKQAFEIFAHLVGFGFVCYLTFAAWNFVKFSWLLNDMSQGSVAIPLWIPQSGVFIGLSLLGLALLDELLIVLSGRPPSYAKPPPKTTEELLERIAEGGGV
jgi:TRAP-type C4-dicarboxylate transport system permease small subunit